MLNKKSFAVFGCFVLAACGKNTNTNNTTTVDTDSVNAISADTVSEAADSAADESSGAASGFVGASSYSPNSISFSRTCTAGSGNVTVAITASGSKTLSVTRPRMTVSGTVTDSGTISRVWTAPSGGSISCSSNNRAYLDWTSAANVDGLSVAITANRERTATRTLTVTASGKSTENTNNFAAQGTRNITWAQGAGTSGSTITRTKTITSSVTRTLVHTSSKGTNESYSTTVATKSGTPLVVDVVRTTASGHALQSKTIKSGTLVATRTGKDRLESSFANVVFDMTSSTSRCMPTSGSITVDYFASDTGTSADKTYTITFGADTSSTVSITDSSGSISDFPDYEGSGCDLEQE